MGAKYVSGDTELPEIQGFYDPNKDTYFVILPDGNYWSEIGGKDANSYFQDSYYEDMGKLSKRVAAPPMKKIPLTASCDFFIRRSYGHHIEMASAY